MGSLVNARAPLPGPALRLDDLTLGYDRHPAVHHLSARIESGALLAIVGPNGAGKSTLLKAIAGALAPLHGAIDIQGGATPGRIAYLPQSAELDLTFPICVFDLVAMGLWNRTGLFGGFSAADRALVSAALARVGMQGFERRLIGELSGGQVQRALFARLFLQDAGLILLDEPLTAVDHRTSEDLLAIVAQWHAERRTVVAVLHDLESVRRHFPTTLLLARELVAFGPTRDVLTDDHAAAARRMSEAFDDHAGVCRERAA